MFTKQGTVKNNMEKLKQYWIIILIMLIVIGGFFYWFGWRPAQIRKGCFSIAIISSANLESNFKWCLVNNGLEK